MTILSENKSANVLVIGSGGREHAIGWKLLQSNLVSNIYYAPGNGGTSTNIGLDANQVPELIEFAAKHDCITIVGPEGPLATGIVDSFNAADIPILGPTEKCALLESSKIFSKNFMRKNSIPTADFRVFSNNEAAADYTLNKNVDVVIKVDGLAAGKGVFLPNSTDDALEIIKKILVKKEFGDAGNKILIEEKLTGRELSLIVLTDGSCFKLLASAKDYKRKLDNDMGPNTGGMGSFCPVPFFSDEIYHRTLRQIVEPTMKGIREFPEPFKGFLYFGLLIEEATNNPYLLEYNVRMGDPECQPIMMRMNSDLYPYVRSVLHGSLDSMEPLQWSPEHAVCVVMASQGYPGPFKTGSMITGLNSDFGDNVSVFHSGTTRKVDDQLYTRGGRVLSIAARGSNLEKAAIRAYEAVQKISWGNNEQYYRKDIAKVMN
jgi:phosphoribosylamine--glycine ligase